MSRFRFFMLLATVVALAGALTACGGSGSSDEDPRTVIENATFEGVESGTVDVSVGIVSEGDSAGRLDLGLTGAFQSRGPETLPELSLDVNADGNMGDEEIAFEGGVTLLSDRAFVNYEGTEYEVDPTTFGFVRSGIEQGLAEAGSGEEAISPTACQEAVTGIDLTSVVENLENEGSVDVDGTSTTKVSGDLDPEGAIDAVVALSEDPACGAAIGAAGTPPLDELEAARGELDKALQKAHAEIYVGEDGIIRRALVELVVAPEGASDEKVEMNFEITLGEVNEEQTIAAPDDAEPLEGLFGKLGVDPLKLLEAASSGNGLEGLLEGLGGGSSESESGSGSAPSQKYLDCLSEARSAADLADCASLR